MAPTVADLAAKRSNLATWHPTMIVVAATRTDLAQKMTAPAATMTALHNNAEPCTEEVRPDVKWPTWRPGDGTIEDGTPSTFYPDALPQEMPDLEPKDQRTSARMTNLAAKMTNLAKKMSGLATTADRHGTPEHT